MSEDKAGQERWNDLVRKLNDLPHYDGPGSVDLNAVLSTIAAVDARLAPEGGEWHWASPDYMKVCNCTDGLHESAQYPHPPLLNALTARLRASEQALTETQQAIAPEYLQVMAERKAAEARAARLEQALEKVAGARFAWQARRIARAALEPTGE